MATQEHECCAERTIRTLDEWEACKETMGDALLLQMGSPQCVRCPAFTKCIDALKAEWKFRHVYANMHDVEEDLYDELSVTQLPAYVLVTGNSTLAKEGATPEQISQAVQTACAAVLNLEEDF